jgi:hypothetical protein
MATAAKELREFFDEERSEPVTTSQPVTSSQDQSVALNRESNQPPKGRHKLEPRWKPGQSGNPGGRARYQPITDALRAELEREMPGADGKTVAQALAKRLVAIAAGKTPAAIRALEVILDRAEGKVVQRQEVSGLDGAPMQFESIASRQEVEQRIAIVLMQAEERKTEAVTTSQPVTLEGEVTTSQVTPVTTSQPLALNQIRLEPIAGSSNVSAAGYDPIGRTLLVGYKAGTVYVWRKIPQSEYQALRAAESAGGFMKGIEARYGVGEKVEGWNLTPDVQPVRPAPALDLNW